MSHTHIIKDNDKRFVISPDTRAIRSPARTVLAWMDHNSEYITIEIPRYVEGHDISLCNNVEIHYLNYGDEGRKYGLYPVTDLQVDPKDESKMVFTWLVSQNATSIVGHVAFVVRFQCLQGAEVIYSWGTMICESVVVSGSLYNTNKIVEQYADVLEQWKIELESGTVSPDAIDKAIKDYLDENPVDVGNAVTYARQSLTEEQQAQARENIGAQPIGKYIETGDLNSAIDEALTRAKDSGEFDGEDGRTPVKGEDYFTESEIADIAKQAASMVEVNGEVNVDHIDAESVYFSEDLLTTTPIGNITLDNGQATIPAEGKNLKQVWESIFVSEKNPSISQPYVSLSVPEVDKYEVGSKVTPSYTASLNAGSYTYGPTTGVTATSWEVTDSDGNTRISPSGSFPQITVSDTTSYTVTAKATHTEGSTPLTNLGNEYASGKISSGTKSKTSGQISGYRNTFYGTKAEKSTINSNSIRSLSNKSGKSLSNGAAFDVTIPVGAMRVIIAYPAALRDITSIKDQNGMSAEISSSFTKQTVSVEGANGATAIEYKVYYMDFANANNTANVFEVTI